MVLIMQKNLIKEVVLMDFPKIGPARFYRILQQQKETQVLLAALRLDVFSFLDRPITVTVLSDLLHYDRTNLNYFLKALVSIGILQKQGELFSNTEEGKLYLSKNSELYLGEYFLFWDKKTSLNNLEGLVVNGAKAAGNAVKPHGFYDFHELARLAAVEIKTGRVQSFLQSAGKILEEKGGTDVKLLDLGGGSGLMAIEFAKQYPLSNAVIFEHPAVVDIPLSQITKENLEARVSVIAGDFTKDDIGTGYTVVVASGILDFAGKNLENLIKRIHNACRMGAYLYLVSHDVSDDLTSPKEAIIGWLSSHLAGLDILMPKSRIKKALQDGGFQPLQQSEQAGVIARLQGEWYKRI